MFLFWVKKIVQRVAHNFQSRQGLGTVTHLSNSVILAPEIPTAKFKLAENEWFIPLLLVLPSIYVGTYLYLCYGNVYPECNNLTLRFGCIPSCNTSYQVGVLGGLLQVRTAQVTGGDSLKPVQRYDICPHVRTHRNSETSNHFLVLAYW